MASSGEKRCAEMETTTKVKRASGWAMLAALALVGAVACGSGVSETENVGDGPPVHRVTPDAIDRVSEERSLPRSADGAEAWNADAPSTLPVSGTDPRWAYYRG
jgi:hypothetical protein